MKNKYGKSSVRHESITKAIGIYIAKDMRPYSTVDNEGFRRMVNVLDPRYDLPKRNHFADKSHPIVI